VQARHHPPAQPTSPARSPKARHQARHHAPSKPPRKRHLPPPTPGPKPPQPSTLDIGESNGPTRRWHANGPTDSATAHIDKETRRCHTGSTNTTTGDHTTRPAPDPRSAAFTTSMGRTARPRLPRPRRWPGSSARPAPPIRGS
jgi:hypothetical protein